MRAAPGPLRSRTWPAVPAVLAAALVLHCVGAVAAAQAPGLPEAFAQALERLEAGAREDAIALLEPLAADGAAAPQVLALLGALYVETGRHARALEVLEPLTRDEGADPAVLYNAGRAALAQGDLEIGEALLERSVRAAPLSPAARELGLLRGRQDRTFEAYALLRPWALAHPEDVEVRLAAAFCALELERFPDVERLLSDLPQERPQVRLLWGTLMLRRGEPHGALAMVKPLLADHPQEMDADVRALVAEAHLQVGESAAAVEALAGHAGGRPRLALLLARAQHQSGRPEEAVRALRPLMETLPEPDPGGAPRPFAATVALEFGRGLLAVARWSEAAAALETATRLDPGGAQAWQLLAQALQGAGREEEAATALARSTELGAARQGELVRREEAETAVADPTARALARARDLAARGEAEAALGVLRAEQQLAPEDLRPWMETVRLLLSFGRGADALEAAEAALRRAPSHPDALYQRGVALLSLERRAEAERDFRAALASDPQHIATMNDLAVLLILEGRRDEARRLLEAILALRPDDSLARANLERLVQ